MEDGGHYVACLLQPRELSLALVYCRRNLKNQGKKIAEAGGPCLQAQAETYLIVSFQKAGGRETTDIFLSSLTWMQAPM